MEEIKLTPETPEIDNTPLTKPKRKINAPRSEKQIEAFKKAQETRDKNRLKAKEAKEVKMAKIYMENKLKEQTEPKAEPKEEPIKKPVKKTVKYIEDDDDEEEEIVYVKKKKKPIKKKIIYLSDSDDETPSPPKLERQNNRVMRNEPEPEPQKPEPVNYNDFFI